MALHNSSQTPPVFEPVPFDECTSFKVAKRMIMTYAEKCLVSSELACFVERCISSISTTYLAPVVSSVPL